MPMSLVLWLLSSLILNNGVSGYRPANSHSLYGRTIKFPTEEPSGKQQTDVGNCNPAFLGEGVCQFVAGFVDIYYWPEPDADTSCLNIISKATTPLLQDATIEAVTLGGNISMTTYWGCAPRKSSLNDSYTTTAAISTIGNFSFKVSFYNPWSPGPCSGRASASEFSRTSLEARGLHASINVRAHSLITPWNPTQTSSLHGGIVTLGNYTFTSPSIYANFHALTLGLSDVEHPCSIPISMLTFAPGEMSTVVGPPNFTRVLGDDRNAMTKSYDFGDLPCPPQQVMEENWYSPQPGVPYQPLIAMPQQIVDIQPMIDQCGVSFFSGYDPPRTLAPAIAMAPVITTNTPQIAPPPAAPSPTQDPGPRETLVSNNAGQGAIPGQSDEPTQSTVTLENDDNPISFLGSSSHLQANSVATSDQIVSEAGITFNPTSPETGDPGTSIESSDGPTVINSEYDSFTVASRASGDRTMAGIHSSGPHATGLAGSGNSQIIVSALGFWNNSRSKNGTGAGTDISIFTGTANILQNYLFAKLMMVILCIILASTS